MNLIDAINVLADKAGLDTTILYQYALEDRVGGRDTGEWPAMSVFSDEGRIIYALIRYLQPLHVLEIGVDSGGTSTHILKALHANNYGELTSVDISPNVGGGIPELLKYRWNLRIGDAASILPIMYSAGISFDFVFEDGPHGLEWTTRVLKEIKKFNPKVILSHDAVSHLYVPGDFAVLAAFKAALGTDDYVLTDGSIAGLCYYFKEAV